MKCLLIVPNAESALNEEAGKLLLEQYEDYFQRAKMMTEIHAKAAHQVLWHIKMYSAICLRFGFVKSGRHWGRTQRHGRSYSVEEGSSRSYGASRQKEANPCQGQETDTETAIKSNLYK